MIGERVTSASVTPGRVHACVIARNERGRMTSQTGKTALHHRGGPSTQRLVGLSPRSRAVAARASPLHPLTAGRLLLSQWLVGVSAASNRVRDVCHCAFLIRTAKQGLGWDFCFPPAPLPTSSFFPPKLQIFIRHRKAGILKPNITLLIKA